MEQKYLYFGDVSLYIISYYNNHKKGLDFRTAYLSLMEAGKYRQNAPDVLDFSAWNRKNIHELAQLADKIPIYTTNIDPVIPCYIKDSNTTILPTVAQVQINFETPYAPDTFTSLEYFVILYVLEGTAVIHFPGRTQTLKTGELVILPPGLPHWCLHHPTDYVLNILSDKNHFEQNFFQLFKTSNIISDFFRHTLFQSSTDFLMFYLPVNDVIRSLTAQLFSEYVSDDSYASAVFNNYLQIFYFNILRYCSNSHRHFHAKQNRAIELTMPSVIQYINDHYHTLTLSTLAAEFHYDSAYLCKMIKKYTSKNYSVLITDLKIEEAKQLLTQTSMCIEEISDAAGFHSSDHFTHTFRKITGMPPTVYRKHFIKDKT